MAVDGQIYGESIFWLMARHLIFRNIDIFRASDSPWDLLKLMLGVRVPFTSNEQCAAGHLSCGRSAMCAST